MPVKRYKKRWIATSPSGAPISSHKTRLEAEIAAELAEAYRRQLAGYPLTPRQQEMIDSHQMRRG